MTTFGEQLGRIRRHWWIVAVFAVLSVAVAVGASLLQTTTYTGRAALIVSSNGRSPDQDAVLVQGYVDYFNAAGYQRQILAAAQAPQGITATAKTAAASPIMLIEATAGDATTAGQAATRVAEGFRTNMNAIRASGTADAIDAVKAQLAAEQAAAGPNPSTATIATITGLQNQLQSLQSDQTNQLQLLQPDGGVAVTRPPLLMNAVLGLVGGLLAGCLAALVLAAARGRIASTAEISGATGLDTLVRVTGGSMDDPRRARSVRRLAAVVATAGLPEHSVIAVLAPAGRLTASKLCMQLCATLRADGGQVRLVRAANGGEVTELRGDAAGMGDRDRIPLLGIGGAVDGPASAADVCRRVDHLRTAVRLTVVDASEAEDAASVSALCAAADAAVLVIEEGAARAVDAREYAGLLRRIGVRVLGAVAVAPDRVGWRWPTVAALARRSRHVRPASADGTRRASPASESA